FEADNVIYSFTLTSKLTGCRSLTEQRKSVTVNPTPEEPGIVPMPSPCAKAENLNVEAVRKPESTNEYYSWQGTGSAVVYLPENAFPKDSGKQFAVVSFPTAGDGVVAVKAFVRGFGTSCPSNESTLPLKSTQTSASMAVNVVQYNRSLIALSDGVDRYQWGKDDLKTLDSTVLFGESSQTLTIPREDSGSMAYWVMVTYKGGCVQKAYYNKPALKPSLS